MEDWLKQFYDLKHKVEEQKEPDLRIGEITSSIYLDLIPEIKGKRCLDIGIGTAWVSFELLKRGCTEVIGIDVSEERMKNAQRKAEEYGFTNCHFFVQNAEAMEDLTDVSFDFINCRDVIEHLTDYHRGLDEMYRVLKDGGGLLIQTPNAFVHEKLKIPHRTKTILSKIFPTKIKMEDTNIMLSDDIKKLSKMERETIIGSIPDGFSEHNKLFFPSELLKILCSHGFKVVKRSGVPILSDLMYQEGLKFRLLSFLYLLIYARIIHRIFPFKFWFSDNMIIYAIKDSSIEEK